MNIQLVRLNDSHTCCLISPAIRWPDMEPPSAPLLENHEAQNLVDYKKQRLGYLGFDNGVYDRKKGLRAVPTQQEQFNIGLIKTLLVSESLQDSTLDLEKKCLKKEWEKNNTVLLLGLFALRLKLSSMLENISRPMRHLIARDDVSLLHLLAEVEAPFFKP